MSLEPAASGESIVEVADRHRQLQNRAVALDALVSVETRCVGRSEPGDSPRFISEIHVAAEHEAVPPTVLDLLADLGLALEPMPPQGDHVVVHAR